MNRVGRLLICIAGALTLSVSSRADCPVAPTPNVGAPRLSTNVMNTLMRVKKDRHTQNMPPGLPSKSGPGSDDPYQIIVTRNVFGLNPIPPQNQAPVQQGPLPPKITLTGITTIFGPAEALFKVAGVARPGRPPKDEFYTFTEGEEEDDVAVTKIDTQKNIVTFINHGVEQEIPLADGVASTGASPSAPSWPGQNGGMRRFGGGRPFNRPGFGGGPVSLPRPFGGGFNRGANNGMSSGQ